MEGWKKSSPYLRLVEVVRCGRDGRRCSSVWPLLRRMRREREGRQEEGAWAFNDGVFLLWLRPSRDRGVSWNVQDAGGNRMLTGCGEEED